MKPIWKGSISFGLVSIPVKLVTSVKSKGLQLHLACKCGEKVKYIRHCSKCNKEVAWDEVKRRYDISSEQYVLIEQEELKKIRPKSSKMISIKCFTDFPPEIVFFNKHYYLVPDKAGEHSYSVLLRTMKKKGKVAIGKITLRDKEHVAVIFPFRNVLMLSLLYHQNEIKQPPEIEIRKVKEEELELASLLIEKMTSKLKLEEFRDEYSENLKKLIEAKIAGEAIEVKPEEEARELKDLIEALKISIEKIKEVR